MYEIYTAANGQRYVGYSEGFVDGHELMVPVYGPFAPGEDIPARLLNEWPGNTPAWDLYTSDETQRTDNPWVWQEFTTQFGHPAMFVSNKQTGETHRFTFMSDGVLVTDENTGEYLEGGHPAGKYEAFLKYVREGGEQINAVPA